jgi:transcription antitermination protein NusB
MSKRRGVEPQFDPRSQSRERALSLLYEAGVKSISGREVLDALIVPVDESVREIVLGVGERQGEIDGIISAFAEGWTIDRMPTIDVLILRIAVFEILSRPDVPLPVVLDEAVELAKRFSTDDSGRYVNGVLSAVGRRHRS